MHTTADTSPLQAGTASRMDRRTAATTGNVRVPADLGSRAQSLLALQRAGGNSAVSRMLGAGAGKAPANARPVSLQRTPCGHDQYGTNCWGRPAIPYEDADPTVPITRPGHRRVAVTAYRARERAGAGYPPAATEIVANLTDVVVQEGLVALSGGTSGPASAAVPQFVRNVWTPRNPNKDARDAGQLDGAMVVQISPNLIVDIVEVKARGWAQTDQRTNTTRKGCVLAGWEAEGYKLVLDRLRSRIVLLFRGLAAGSPPGLRVTGGNSLNRTAQAALARVPGWNAADEDWQHAWVFYNSLQNAMGHTFTQPIQDVEFRLYSDGTPNVSYPTSIVEPHRCSNGQTGEKTLVYQVNNHGGVSYGCNVRCPESSRSRSRARAAVPVTRPATADPPTRRTSGIVLAPQVDTPGVRRMVTALAVNGPGVDLFVLSPAGSFQSRFAGPSVLSLIEGMGTRPTWAWNWITASALVSAGVSLLALTAILGVVAGEIAAASAAAGQALQISSVAAQAVTPAAAAQVRLAAVHYLTRTAASEVATSPAASRIAAAAAAAMVLTAARSSQAAGFHLTGVEDPLLCVPESQLLPRIPAGTRPYWGMPLPFHGETNLIGRVVR